MRKFFFSAITLIACAMSANAAAVATFENEAGGINTTTEAPYWYGIAPIVSDENEWGSGDYGFVTFNDDAWGPSYYYDFVVSNDKENEYTDYAHAYRSTQGGAYEGDNFAVWYNNFYGNSPIVPKAKGVVPGCFVCNCAYTANSMVNGDGYCKKYTKESYYRIIFTGQLAGAETGSVKVALAENGTYINKWTFVDLSSLGEVDEVLISYETSDYGTPTYFCLDNFGAEKPAAYEEPARAKFFMIADFENEAGGIQTAEEAPYWYGIAPIVSGKNEWTSGSFALATYNDDAWGPSYYYDFVVSNDKENEYTDYAHAYRSAQGGAYEGDNFAVWYNNFYGNAPIKLGEKHVVPGCFVCNCAYTANSMNNGDGYCTKYTKESYYRIILTGKLAGEETGSVKVALAEDGTYINKWTFVDLSSLGEVDEVLISYETSDAGTPTYFCLDNFGAEKPAGYEEPARAEFDLTTAISNTNADAKAVKAIRNGQVVIIRGNKAFNVLGAEL